MAESSSRPPIVVEGVGLDSIEYKASKKDVGVKIYGDFGTPKGQTVAVEKLNSIIKLRVQLAAVVCLPLPDGTMAHLPSENSHAGLYVSNKNLTSHLCMIMGWECPSCGVTDIHLRGTILSKVGEGTH